MSPDLRVGLGSDLHRLVEGKPLVIGGVAIEHSKGFDAHSDGDVLLHAAVDAMLGAAALGDIGELFPDTDPQYNGADSAAFIKKTLELLTQAGWRPVNLDAIISAQAPRLSPHKSKIRANVAKLLDLSPDRVSIKAKTGEKVGPIGEERAIGAEVIVLIERAGSK